jgi:hypothetical protein
MSSVVGHPPEMGSAGSPDPAGVVERYFPGQTNRLTGPHRKDYIRLGLIYWSRWAKSSEMRNIMIAASSLIEKIENGKGK